MLLIIQTDFLLPLLIFTVVGIIIFCVYYFSAKNVIIRTLKRIPKQSLGSLRPNVLTKITGKALHVTEPLIAPLSKRPCVF